ncbi:MAG: FAD-dependent oxidoreductase, partial [Chloroflexi bacterium]|nr:FAD-dependent oxidoreductase [Chloroflexota bacterium]
MADFDVVVIGAGPGGYIAAIRAAQLGLNTAVVERGDVGGICLNWGCIPSKALLRNAEVLSLFGRAGEFGISYDNLRFDFGTAIDRSRSVVERLRKGVEFLLRKNKITVVRGEGVLKSSHEVKAKETGQVLSTNYIILATGARARTLPVLPIDGRTVVTSREALEQREVPKAVVIVGGGPTGCEFAYLYNTYGARVTLVEMLPHLLPNEDPEVSVALERAFSQQGIETLTGSKVVGMEKQDSMAQVVVEGKTGKQAIACDRVLVA